MILLERIDKQRRPIIVLDESTKICVQYNPSCRIKNKQEQMTVIVREKSSTHIIVDVGLFVSSRENVNEFVFVVNEIH
jgi:hypothetical protein